MKKQIFIMGLLVTLLYGDFFGQDNKRDSTYRRYYVGSTFFLLGNLASSNKPDFVQLNVGYRITPKNVVSIELKTWKYAWPLGIPYGESFEAEGEKYPGYIREFGIALVYQRFFWKGIYAAVHAMPTLQNFVNEDNKKIDNGFQLFLQYRVGYHIQLFKNRFFVEPSVAMNHWPIRSKSPESFNKLENKWPNYFLIEPGLNFGFKF